MSTITVPGNVSVMPDHTDTRAARSGLLTKLQKTSDQDTYRVEISHIGITATDAQTLVDFRLNNATNAIVVDGRDGYNYVCRFSSQYQIKPRRRGMGVLFDAVVTMHGTRQ